MRLSRVGEAVLVPKSRGHCESISLEVRNDDFSDQL